MKEFDENNAIKQMRAALPADVASIYDDDELFNVLDMIWEYYEENGMLEIDMEDDDDADEDIVGDLTDYVTRMLRKDKGAKLDPQYVRALVEAELDYESSLED
ncbi:MAG: hypothetical protein K2H59_05400 [Muribaculaceae bacterium]|nr:hypothetical protein [Muribaculaceae bacterium]